MCAVRVHDGEIVKEGDWVAVYQRLSALHYTALRPTDPTHVVNRVSIVESTDGGIKLENSGWYPIRCILKISSWQALKWMIRHRGRQSISDKEARAEAART